MLQTISKFYIELIYLPLNYALDYYCIFVSSMYRISAFQLPSICIILLYTVFIHHRYICLKVPYINEYLRRLYASTQQLLHTIIFILNVWVFFILNKSCLQKLVYIHLLY